MSAQAGRWTIHPVRTARFALAWVAASPTCGERSHGKCGCPLFNTSVEAQRFAQNENAPDAAATAIEGENQNPSGTKGTRS